MQSPPTTRGAGIAALSVSLAVGMTSNLLFLAAFQFRVDWVLEPTRVLAGGATSAELLRWASVLDLIGYYLATAVLAYVLWQWLRPRNRLIADLSAVAALGYVLAGGIGAAVLAMVGPMLMYTRIRAPAVLSIEPQAIRVGVLTCTGRLGRSHSGHSVARNGVHM